MGSWLKEEILLRIMAREERASMMVRILKMRILSIDILKEECCQWQIKDPIPMEVSFLLLLKSYQI